MNYVHSLWTGPMISGERNQKTRQQVITTIWCHANSVAYLRKLGRSVVLYGDEFAKEMLSFLPYDDVKTINIPKDNPTCLWAQGKFYAYQQMPIHDVHIDGDVFIKTEQLAEIIEQNVYTHDLIVQSLEDNYHTNNDYYTICRDIARTYQIELAEGATLSLQPALNCGLVGFGNYKLKEEYLNNYFHCLEQIKNNELLQQTIKAAQPCWMDLLFEQQHLYELSLPYRVYNLLGWGQKAYDEAIRLGYQHLLGDSKWACLKKLQKQVEYIDKHIYNNAKEATKNALNQL